MAAAIGSYGASRFGGANLPKPATIVMAYTGLSDTSSNEPPTFAVVGENDAIAPPAVMERRVAALRRSGTDVEYHKYPNVGHGFGVGIGTTAEGAKREAAVCSMALTRGPCAELSKTAAIRRWRISNLRIGPSFSSACELIAGRIPVW
jgi:acetyl esterase/lipase